MEQNAPFTMGHNPKYEPGQRIVQNGQTKVILDVDDGQYKMKKKEGGGVGWVDSVKVDMNSKTYDEQYG